MVDLVQKKYTLFPQFRHHMLVINFWLESFVFPREAKQFHYRIVSSAWDLSKQKHLPVTGFSGTNDSKLLLPLSIK
jgi:hypothetical protein